MKAVTIRLTDDELAELRKIKDAGFASLAEVIKCAALSYAAASSDMAQQNTQENTTAGPLEILPTRSNT